MVDVSSTLNQMKGSENPREPLHWGNALRPSVPTQNRTPVLETLRRNTGLIPRTPARQAATAYLGIHLVPGIVSERYSVFGQNNMAGESDPGVTIPNIL